MLLSRGRRTEQRTHYAITKRAFVPMTVSPFSWMICLQHARALMNARSPPASANSLHLLHNYSPKTHQPRATPNPGDH